MFGFSLQPGIPAKAVSIDAASATSQMQNFVYLRIWALAFSVGSSLPGGGFLLVLGGVATCGSSICLGCVDGGVGSGVGSLGGAGSGVWCSSRYLGCNRLKQRIRGRQNRKQ